MYCENEDVEKSVLDCGAGGNMPPLSLFADSGYSTAGIEFNDAQIEKAEEFSQRSKQILNIDKGDMRKLAFGDESFGCVYSYNSIFHMKKMDIRQSVYEMKRVLKKGGLLFLNLVTTDDEGCGEGRALGDNQFMQMEDGEVIHSYFDDSEADIYFQGCELIMKETRILNRIFDGQMIRKGYLDYIFRKPVEI